MEVVVNWRRKRAKHALERMMLRGISQKEFRDAIIKGKKVRQKNGIFEVFARFYSVIYEEKIYKERGIRKIFPITVKLW